MENTEGCPTPLIRNPTSKIMEDNNDKSLRGLNLLGEDSGALIKKSGGADGRKFMCKEVMGLFRLAVVI